MRRCTGLRRPGGIDGRCKFRRVAATPYPAYGIEEKVGFVGRVSAAPPGVTYSDHRSRPASFALYSAAS
ncbi:hypothetical protein, partial [Enterobacter hormaechei]|uniref:hypothetical protein n=1 Tax=Enterobacter hormaechei TaxID=158836 RepID=UPI001C5325A6